MKKILVPYAILASGIFLSSCSNSSKLSIAKRHYRSGYYVGFGSKAPTVTTASANSLPHVKGKSNVTPVAIAKSETYITPNVPVAAFDKPKFVDKIKILKKLQKNTFLSISSNATYQNSPTLNNRTNNDVTGSAGGGERANVSVPFVVIVLCAIFIPPLGVGLMYGINSYFWIDLILTLLFFFPGMIFAIIVVLM